MSERTKQIKIIDDKELEAARKGTFLRGNRIVFIPKVRVLPIDPEDNARFIKNFLSRDKQKNTTRPFYDKTIALYPELKDVAEIEDEAERDMAIRLAVFKRLADNEAEIRQRIQYFTEKFDSFIPQFIEASCALFNYEWKESQPEIICYVGYIPFYPRSSQDKCFFVSYQDEERVFSGAVHEINHMIFYEKLCEMKGVTLPDPVWPEPLWYLQEIVVDPTLNEPEVRKFTLYDNKAYPQFYEPLHGTDESIMDKVKRCFDERVSIEAFLTEALEIVKENMEL